MTNPDWVQKDKVRKDLEAVFEEAYSLRGFERWQMFTEIAVLGVRYRMIPITGAVKLMFYGCALNRSVRFRN